MDKARVTSDNYVELATTTENKDFWLIGRRMDDSGVIRLLHAAMGMCTETGEFMDALKKHLMYGKPLDGVNMLEELGDQMWYIALAMDELSSGHGPNIFNEVLERNIRKLAARYPEKFAEHAALVRNLEAERVILEGRDGK